MKKIMDISKKKEESGWKIISEKALKTIWNNKKDSKSWKKYL